MAVGIPLPTNYTDGDVWSASDVNDITGTINQLGGGNYAAGKNKIINGDLRINQRAFTSNTTNDTYNFDRFVQFNGGTTGTHTVTPQVFTPGTAPVSGYEGRNFVQCVTASGASTNTYAIYSQKIESVRTLAGQTATISFWAKASSGTPKIGLEIEQNFGTGGSPSATVTTSVGAVTLTTSWARYSATVTVPSISGKTIGTNNNDSLWVNLWLSSGSDFAARASSIGLQNNTFQIWGIQVENGSTATAFQTATGTIQGELAACQRYYIRYNGVNQTPVGVGSANATTSARIQIAFPVEMRVGPTAIDSGGSWWAFDGSTTNNISAFALYSGTGKAIILQVTTTALTVYRTYFLIAANDPTAFVGFTAEL
jgi:hypothetical protein